MWGGSGLLFWSVVILQVSKRTENRKHKSPIRGDKSHKGTFDTGNEDGVVCQNLETLSGFGEV
jgi:hypothetical protein